MGFKEKVVEAEYAISFDDIAIMPSYTEVDPREVDLRTKFSTNVSLQIPLASSPMDTVTELDMAVAMALLGGIGVVHRNMEIDKQVEIVKKVKEHPPIRLRRVYIDKDSLCGYAIEVLKRYGYRCLPVTEAGKAIGYIHISDALSVCKSGLEPVPIRSGRVFTVKEVDEARKAVLSGELDTAAIVDSNGFYIGTLTLDDVYTDVLPAVDRDGRLVVAAAISPFDRARALKLDKYVDAFVSDVAHFHNRDALYAAKKLVKEVSADFVAGNIASGEAVKDVVSVVERVDGFRVGLGGGSICTTPDVAGAYVPTPYAVALVRDAVDELNLRVPVIADGGIRSSGDIVKALALGASVAMVGYLLAGTDEASAPAIAIGNRLYKPYRGMASRGAMSKRFAVDRYARVSKRVPEGVEGLVEYKGSVYTVVQDIVEGIKAGLGYAGAKNIEELWKKARIIRVAKKAIPVKVE